MLLAFSPSRQRPLVAAGAVPCSGLLRRKAIARAKENGDSTVALAGASLEPEPLDLDDLTREEQDEILLIIDTERQAFKVKLDHLKAAEAEMQKGTAIWNVAALKLRTKSKAVCWLAQKKGANIMCAFSRVSR